MMPKNDAEWKKKLTDQQFKVLRKKSTELPFTGKLLYNKDSGVYMCAGCGASIFSSDKKFDSGTGWPSFWEPIKDAVKTKIDKGLFMTRTEVICAKCDGHLGHVFGDGPESVTDEKGEKMKASGLRYCINSCSLNFKDKKKS